MMQKQCCKSRWGNWKRELQRVIVKTWPHHASSNLRVVDGMVLMLSCPNDERAKLKSGNANTKDK
jgi:hypothetical protein